MLKLKSKVTSLLVVLFLLMLCFNSSLIAENNLGNDSNNYLKQLELQKKYHNQLAKLGFPDKTINFLSPDEIEDIVANNYRFIKSSESKNLIINFKASKDNGEINIPLSEQDVKEYNLDQETLVAKKVDELLKTKPEYKKYITTSTQYLVTGTPSVSQYIDWATITLSVDVYDSSTPGYIYKTFGVNWEWDAPPTWSLTDAAGISYTGYWWTDILDMGGYYHNTYSDPEWQTLAPSVCANGATIMYDIQTGYGPQDGRIWIRAGNIDSAVPNSLYTIYGAYGHTSVSTSGLSIGIDQSGLISISTTLQSTLTEVAPNPYMSGLYAR